MELPPRPAGTEALWHAFLDLHQARSPGAMGPGPITFRDLVAWQQCQGVALTPWEVDTIMELGRVAVEAQTGGEK